MKTIEAIDDNGQACHRFKSIRDAVREGVATSEKLLRDALKGRQKRHAGFRWRYAGDRALPPIRPAVDGGHRVLLYIKMSCDPRGEMKWADFASRFAKWVEGNFIRETVDRERLLELVQTQFTIRQIPGGPKVIEGLQWKAGVRF
ncbi:hypothetical protein [Anatilimnocola floriformis]|uniref:hypothetical protein n=1 Tax=Anatilimnocola floriformis TaxID=2948575 RepID=UPI0020C393D5|nr:hypothetical protein [Anatilimnocola floriformis]